MMKSGCLVWACVGFGLGFLVEAVGAPVLSIAHRGNSMFAPENTMSAFLAAEGKADLVETDGRFSSDGVLVIMHDADRKSVV